MPAKLRKSRQTSKRFACFLFWELINKLLWWTCLFAKGSPTYYFLFMSFFDREEPSASWRARPIDCRSGTRTPLWYRVPRRRDCLYQPAIPLWAGVTGGLFPWWQSVTSVLMPRCRVPRSEKSARIVFLMDMKSTASSQKACVLRPGRRCVSLWYNYFNYAMWL